MTELFGKAAEDDAWQREQRDRILAPQFYARFASRFIFIGHKAVQQLGIDTIAVSAKTGQTIYVEEKIVRAPPKAGTSYSAFCIEMESCTVEGHQTPGWMHTCDATHLLYCFQTQAHGLDCYLIDWPAFKAWFMAQAETFKPFGPLEEFWNKPSGRLVPIEAVRRGIGYRLYELQPAKESA